MGLTRPDAQRDFCTFICQAAAPERAEVLLHVRCLTVHNTFSTVGCDVTCKGRVRCNIEYFHARGEDMLVLYSAVLKLDSIRTVSVGFCKLGEWTALATFSIAMASFSPKSTRQKEAFGLRW